MSDFMFMLESRLTPIQSRVVAAVEAAAEDTDSQVFLAGGALRDMLGGFPIMDLDFTIQGDAVGLARRLASATGAETLSTDNLRQTVELSFPGGQTVEIAMSRQEEYSPSGGRPKVTPAPIWEDLLRRDFSVNAIGLSLHPASRGLLLDPATAWPTSSGASCG